MECTKERSKGRTERNSSAYLRIMRSVWGERIATTNEGGGEFKMAGASLLDLKATPIVARWSNHRKGVGFASRTTLTGVEETKPKPFHSFPFHLSHNGKLLLKLM